MSLKLITIVTGSHYEVSFANLRENDESLKDFYWLLEYYMGHGLVIFFPIRHPQNNPCLYLGIESVRLWKRVPLLHLVRTTAC